MKRNVDLTENRDFRFKTRGSFAGETLGLGNSMSASKELFLTGNGFERKCKKEVLSFGVPDNCCDCCGTTNPLKFIGKSSLCVDCEKSEPTSVWWKHASNRRQR